jgi:hypothetical protein
LLLVLPVGQVLMERRIEMSRQYQGGGLCILCRLVMKRRDNEEEPSIASRPYAIVEVIDFEPSELPRHIS